jgi:RNA 3'-terminal phosphate cyclase
MARRPNPVEEKLPLQPGEAETIATVHGNGHSKSPSLEETEQMMLQAAEEWAREAGLQPPLDVMKPHRVEYPRQGHGWQVTITEREARRRMGTAVFGSDGQRKMWTMDTAGGSCC